MYIQLFLAVVAAGSGAPRLDRVEKPVSALFLPRGATGKSPGGRQETEEIGTEAKANGQHAIKHPFK